MDIDKELELAALARTQHGNITRAQLIEIGLAPSTIWRRTRSGVLIPVGARTYRMASAEGGRTADTAAACLDRGGVASHVGSCWLRGFIPDVDVIDVTVPRGRSARPALSDVPGLRLHTTTSFPAADIDEVHGIRAFSTARTLMTLAALVPDEVSEAELLDVVSGAIETRAASIPWLRWVLDQRRCRGRNGVTAFERAIDARLRIGPTESQLERRFVTLLDGAGMPLPRLQQKIARGRGTAARVDFLYVAERIVVETLGYAFHRTPEQISADTMRANELQVAGYRVLQFTSRTLDREPDQVVAIILAMLGGGRLAA